MRLIDADKFLSQLEDQYMEHDITREKYIDLEDRIMQQPTIDAVEVVRCRDCKHRQSDGCCEAWGFSFHYWEDFDKVPEDMFCGHGERREK